MKFSYSSGQRPLDGYTLKRGIGLGGFGEVYYGVSDGGKEVALKLVKSNLEIELRGVAQCLNLKHPNLVNLYDLRTDARGDHWVVMEYVAGEPLSTVLGRHQQGLAPELIHQWFPALARAVTYLHDHGIVHRDLKPGNIFLENGIIKIGDYGLSKCMSSSQRIAQTQSVGTVHYMAPEIGSGNYNKQIDIYAAGIILYEMLTGKVPFDGESSAEILMKHLTAQPDLSKLPPGYAPIVGQALAKDPAKRYASMADMARAVEALSPTPSREPRPRPQAPRPAEVVAARVPASAVQALPEVLPPLTLNAQISELCGSLALGAVVAAFFAMLWSAVGHHELTDVGSLLFLTVAASWATLVTTKFWQTRRKDSWSRRLTMAAVGVGLGLVTLWIDGWVPRPPPTAVVAELDPATPVPVVFTIPGPTDLAEASATLSYFAVVFFAIRWWRMTDRRRSQRFSFAPVLAAGCWSCLLLLVWPQWRGALAMVMASAIVQLVSPWEQPPPPSAKRLRLRCV
jgi:hypothetical protein